MTNVPNILDKYLHSINEFTELSGLFILDSKNNKQKESILGSKLD
ncbi:161_t:CDS:2 [Ambispora leptoticha]|uniref:161_t:CDS:1 n=1 Tax=Ambispora leptoticha TaxID=144679 RepID=A0A9N9G0J2_9GLOM|nr:161_t:CDS:2 [Ambispora leptoticha]